MTRSEDPSKDGLLLLRADNFTPPTRTPWGGRKIVERYKRGAPLAPDKLAYDVVGESWELSVEPAFPSRCQADDVLLRDVLAAHADALLGAEASRGSTALLVKLLDAKRNLSVQVHPEDDYAGLAPGQSGKPEAWFVIDREPGAGIHLGFRPGVEVSDVRVALEQDGDLSRLMRFVAVEPGDFFLIEPGMVHCVGAGVTLVEPQVVRPGCEGVTYRMWAWGEARELHVEDALAVTDFAHPMDDTRLARCHRRIGVGDASAAARTTPLCGLEGGLASPWLRVVRLDGTGPCALPAWNALRAVTIVEGQVRVGALGWLGPGRTVAVGANAGALSLELDHALVLVAAVA